MPILVEGITFAYRARRVLDRFSCRIEEGVMTALVGPSGSGKSTLIGLLVGQLTPAGGRIRYPASLLAGGELDPHRIAWVMQTANVFARRSALDNVALPLRVAGTADGEAHGRAAEALARTGLADRVGDRAGRLSGGQRQRVAVARALAAGAPLLIADEPTVALDHDTKHRLVDDLLLAAEAGAVVLVATHDPAVAVRCGAQVSL